MSHGLEQANGVWRHAVLDAQFVRPELVVRARRILGLATLRPWSITLRMICTTVEMMVEPPGLPVAIRSLPSLSTRVGLIDERGRFIDPGALASPPRRP